MVEPVIWTKELGYTVLTITKWNEPKLSRLIETYPPDTWDKTVFLKPKWKYTEKQLVKLHNTITYDLEMNTFKDMNCFTGAVYLHKIASHSERTDGKDVFGSVMNWDKANVKDFTKNGNLQPIMLQGKK